MNKFVKTKELFDYKVSCFADFFEKYEYPWEMLGHIKEYIVQLTKNGMSGFREILPGVFAGENVKIYPGAVIEGPAVIASGTQIRPGAFIRAGVITGKNCVIGNSSELKNCILLDNVQLPHYNYVGDSVIGNGAHMGAGAVCSNLKSDGKNVVIHGDTEYPTQLRKVGGFLGDGADVGCGCVLNPGTVIGKRTSVYPLTPLRGVYPADCIVKSQNEITKRQ